MTLQIFEFCGVQRKQSHTEKKYLTEGRDCACREYMGKKGVVMNPLHSWKEAIKGRQAILEYPYSYISKISVPL